jgi:hypothetical protein
MRKLIFVYNADSGTLSAALDIAHKLISPATYNCQLCALTHGVLSEREEWQAYRRQSADELIFFHKDEFEKRYPDRFTYPIVLKESGDGLRVHIGSEEINRLKDVSELIALLNTR